MNSEPILSPENNRMSVYPIKYESIWQAYKIQQAANWTAEEIDFSKDHEDFLKLISLDFYHRSLCRRWYQLLI